MPRRRVVTAVSFIATRAPADVLAIRYRLSAVDVFSILDRRMIGVRPEGMVVVETRARNAAAFEQSVGVRVAFGWIFFWQRATTVDTRAATPAIATDVELLDFHVLPSSLEAAATHLGAIRKALLPTTPYKLAGLQSRVREV